MAEILKLPQNFAKHTFDELCHCVKMGELSYHQVAETIEDMAYADCMNGKYETIAPTLIALASHLEEKLQSDDSLNETLADLYILIGELAQSIDEFDESINWFNRAISLGVHEALCYHNLGAAFLELDDVEKSIQYFEKEIDSDPGNYYTYLTLSDLYIEQKMIDKAVTVLERLLKRDGQNIQALHKLIVIYEESEPNSSCELLRSQLVSIEKNLVKLDLVIWTYHMCCLERFEEIISFLDERQKENPAISIINLLKAHVYGRQQLFVKKKKELVEFKKKNVSRPEYVMTLFEEFSKIFGLEAGQRLHRKMNLTNITTR